MSEKDLQEVINALRSVAEEYGSDPEKARKFLQDAGILNSDGELAEPYRS